MPIIAQLIIRPGGYTTITKNSAGVRIDLAKRQAQTFENQV